MKFIVIILVLLLPLSATPENPLIPDTWFQEITATDGSTQQCVIFTTIPGVEYTFYHSDALETWTEIGKTYGLGQQFSAAMRETAPAPPPPDPQNPPAYAPERSNASITIQASAAVEGGTVISWPSLDHGNAVQYLITGNMATDWDTVPMFVEAYGTHQFFISHPTGSSAPPATNPILDTKDAAMIADLEAAWSTFNTSVANAATIARNTPPPPPPAPGSKGFWRIKADWSLDSDGDGSLDHAEFALAAEGADANGLVGNPFNADTDGNGIPDGNQLDKDKDGTPDAEDVDPNDDLTAYKKVSLPRYAMFEFDDYFPRSDGRPLSNSISMNDRGTVLFNDRVWKADEYQTLNAAVPGVVKGDSSVLEALSEIAAFSINDHDEIIGYGSALYRKDGHIWAGFGGGCHWSDATAVPKQVYLAAGSTTTYASLLPKLWLEELFPRLDNHGRFFTDSFSIEDGEEFSYDDQLVDWRQWELPRLQAGLTAVAATEDTIGTTHGGVQWTSKHSAEDGEWLNSRIIAPFVEELPFSPRNILHQGDSGLLVVTSSSRAEQARVRKNDGTWGTSKLLANALDISTSGTAIGKRSVDGTEPGEILLNGKWTSMERAVPGIPQNWLANSNVKLADTTANGWILAQDRGHSLPADNKAAALLPIRVKGQFYDCNNTLVEEAVGVDDFSITSSEPDKRESSTDQTKPIQEKIWAMVPMDGLKTLVLTAPLHSTAPHR